jgi:flagellar transcriptional activator FlhD
MMGFMRTDLPPAPAHANLQAEIRDLNLAYLVLAQRLLHHDPAEGCVRLGLSAQSAEWILALSTAQLLAVAQRGELLCRMRVDDDLVWGLLTGRPGPGALAVAPTAWQRLHASALLASPESRP